MDPSIPCKICSDKSAGIHYGVPSCEACKSFFKRCNQKPPESNKCRRPGKCTIVPARRNNCAECRYMKCLEVGMSINNIKTGRYSAKQLEESRKTAEKYQRQQELEKNGFFADHKLKGEEIDEAVHKMVEARKIIVKLVQAKVNNNYPRFMRVNVLSRERPFKERLEESFKLRKPEFFKSIVLKVVKDIPGFPAIAVEDQIELIKANRLDFRMIYQAVNVDDRGTFVIVNEKFKILIEDIKHAANLPDELTEKGRAIRKKLHSLELSDEERVVLSCLTLTSTDRSIKIDDKAQVERVQNNLLQCLDYIIKKQHPNEKGRLARILTIIADLRSCTDELIKSKHDLVLQYPDINLPQGIRDMWYSELQEAYDMDKIRSELKNIDLDFISPESTADKTSENELVDLEKELDLTSFDISLFPHDIDTLFQ